MEIQRNRRRWIREVLNPPEIGILFTGGGGEVPGIAPSAQPKILFVDLLNRSLGGGIIRTKWRTAPETSFQLKIYNNLEEKWQLLTARSKWSGTDPHYPAYTVIGVEFVTDEIASEAESDGARHTEEIPRLFDFEFFKNTRFFTAVPRDAVCALLNSLRVKEKKAGNRLFAQGTKIDRCFLIQEGSCTVSIDQDPETKPIGRLYAGDIVGETALLDDHPVELNVDADSNLILWALRRKAFDSICIDHPDLYGFLTRLLMDRFASTRHSKKRTVGGYVITDIIGEGSRSIVFKGFDRQVHLPVVLKMLKHETALHPRFLERFRTSAPRLRKLRHDNIVQVHDILSGFRTLFLVMERQEGEPLRSLLERWKRISYPRATDLLVQCCRALGHAHRHGVLHGDIRPSNVMITPGDRVKLLDFGLADPGNGDPATTRPPLPWTAPELFEGHPADERCDIYALGVIAHEMITGQPPHIPSASADSAGIARAEAPPDPGRMLPGMPEILRRFILKSVDTDPSRRFESADAALNHLQPLAEAYGIQRPDRAVRKRKVAVFSLLFNENDQEQVKKSLAELRRRVQKFDAVLKAVDIKEL
jgi:serine/threonine-protein kinase